MEEVFSEGQTKIYKNKQAFPRAFFVSSVKSVSDRQEAIKSLFDENVDLHSTAIVEDWDKGALEFSSGEAKIVSYTANKIVVSTNSNSLPEGAASLQAGQLFLVFMDTYYPTWHATIDGVETKIYITNYTFRGIVVPAGNHTVIFSNRLL